MIGVALALSLPMLGEYKLIRVRGGRARDCASRLLTEWLGEVGLFLCAESSERIVQVATLVIELHRANYAALTRKELYTSVDY